MPTYSMRIASKRQATLSAQLLDDLRIGEGDVLEITVEDGLVVSGRGLKLVPATLFTDEMLADLRRREKSLDSGSGIDVNNMDQLSAKLLNR